MQNADALIKLRNAIIHFRPEWFDDQKEHEKLSKVLRGKFRASPFLPGEPLFPRAWASRAFTERALRSTVAFLEHFYGASSIECPITKWKTRLRQLSGIVL